MKNLLNVFWYYVRIGMNNPEERISLEDIIFSKMGNSSDIDWVLDKLDEELQKQGISGKFNRNPNLTLKDLITQINNFTNGKNSMY